ncbi:hypothetical protein BDA96_01G259400 [Sorghum bicolor]|uniref:Uncharacterized protein n=2 Tax=Sorghum bicolor TaxID=4558 RepID=A0A921V1B5_SORBI|nr:hypothetical protein BDA96_01G259400 [Sorghum bicolor]KXG38504.1 hypothetical protein SORBI_3001G244800 [Sorghum bicolor]
MDVWGPGRAGPSRCCECKQGRLRLLLVVVHAYCMATISGMHTGGLVSCMCDKRQQGMECKAKERKGKAVCRRG